MTRIMAQCSLVYFESVLLSLSFKVISLLIIFVLLVQTYKTDRPLNSCSISPLFDREDDTKRLHILVAGGQEARDVTTTSKQNWQAGKS